LSHNDSLLLNRYIIVILLVNRYVIVILIVAHDYNVVVVFVVLIDVEQTNTGFCAIFCFVDCGNTAVARKPEL
jgi:hypothetical protein